MIFIVLRQAEIDVVLAAATITTKRLYNSIMILYLFYIINFEKMTNYSPVSIKRFKIEFTAIDDINVAVFQGS